MKRCRNVRTGEVFEVWKQHLDGFVHVKDGTGQIRVFQDEVMETVPEVPVQKKWRDVTAECESGFYEENGRISLTHRKDFWDVLRTHGYRLTKISGPLQPHVAFIVEKEE